MYFCLHSLQCIFKFPLSLLLWTKDSLEVWCSVSQDLGIFLLLISSLIPLLSENTLYDFDSFRFVWSFSSPSRILMIQRMVRLGIYSVSISIRRHTVLLISDVFSEYWLDPVGWWRYWALLYPCLFSNWLFYPFLRRGMLKSPTIVVGLSMSPFSSVSFCFLHSAARLFGAYAFRIAVPSCWVDPFIIM